MGAALPSALGWVRVVAIAVAVANAAVLAMDQVLAALVLRNATRMLYSIALGFIDRHRAVVARAPDGPAAPMRDDVLVLAGHAVHLLPCHERAAAAGEDAAERQADYPSISIGGRQRMLGHIRKKNFRLGCPDGGMRQPIGTWMEATLSEDETGDLSNDEVRAALGRLTKEDYIRLMKAARYHALRGTRLQPEELLSEAVCRALDGTRACRRDLPFVVFLVGAMKSIASAEWEAAKVEPQPLSTSAGAVDMAVLRVPAKDRAADEAIAARQEVERRHAALEDLFQNDAEASLVIAGEMEGMSAEELRQALGIDPKTYASIRRRIRRAINKAYPGGWQA